MLIVVTTLIPGLRPEIVITDFEIAAINIFKTFFPSVEMKGCLFHLGQNIIKNVRTNGFITQFRENEYYKIFIRALICLAFIPEESICDVFDFLFYHPNRPRDTNLTYNYFFNNYIGSPSQRLTMSVLFPMELWSSRISLIYNIPRTNNAIEGWHNKLNRNFEAKCPTFTKFVSQLQKEEESVKQKFINLTNGQTIPLKKAYSSMRDHLLVFLGERIGRDPKSYILDLTGFVYYG